MPEIYACIIFYNDAPLLQTCCESLKTVNIPIIAIDGKYKDFPGRCNYSKDGSIDIAIKYADKYIAADKKFLINQAAKRTRYLREIIPGDYSLVIDTDEIYCGAPPAKDNLTANIYQVSFFEPGVNTPLRPRVFKIYDDLIYYGRHCYLYREKEMNKSAIEKCKQCDKQRNNCYSCENVKPALSGCVNGKEFNVIKDINKNYVLIKHFPLKRPESRLKKDKKYMAARNEIQLSNFIPRPKIEITDNRIITFIYRGNKIIKDPVYKDITPGKIYSMSYGHYNKYAIYYGCKNFEVLKINGLDKSNEQIEVANRWILNARKETEN